MASLILRNSRPVMPTIGWSTFDEFENFVDKFFNGYHSYNGAEMSMQMPVELTEKDDNLVLKASLPGIEKENINIEVSEDSVSISGEYKSQNEENSDLVHRSEFYTGKFERSVSLPQKIDRQKAKAEYKDGILTLTLPKSEKETAKTVKLSL